MVALAKPQYAQEYTLPLDTVIHGDALVELRRLPANSIDACVVDPPYGLGEVKDIAGLLTAWINDEDDSRYLGKGGFMGKQWDAGVPGPRYWKEVYRVLKPGAHILAFGGTRTYDLLVLALRLSGFDCRDMIVWIYGQGFPKSLNIGKVTGLPEHQGLGTALKPAQEPIILARKPLSEKTIAENVLTHGTGGLRVDDCRIGIAHDDLNKRRATSENGGALSIFGVGNHTRPATLTQGRWPANVLFSHTLFCVQNGTKRVQSESGGLVHARQSPKKNAVYGLFNESTEFEMYHDPDGMEEIDDWICSEDCPVRQLGEQSGVRKTGKGVKSKAGHSIGLLRGEEAYHFKQDGSYCEGSTGTASRYFQQFSPDVPFIYASKASRTERNRGCEGLPEQMKKSQNVHPTVKPLSLCRYLVKMITSPNGVVLDMFAGSGSILCAAIYEGMHFIGIEQSNTEQEPYVDICNARIAQAYRDMGVCQ